MTTGFWCVKKSLMGNAPEEWALFQVKVKRGKNKVPKTILASFASSAYTQLLRLDTNIDNTHAPENDCIE